MLNLKEYTVQEFNDRREMVADIIILAASAELAANCLHTTNDVVAGDYSKNGGFPDVYLKPGTSNKNTEEK